MYPRQRFELTMTGCVFSIATAWLMLTSLKSSSADEANSLWRKHAVFRGEHCNTAVALDANQDGKLDVVCGLTGRVSLFLSPDRNREIVIHRMEKAKGRCIHSAVLDVDGDGDLDWAGAVAHDHPFWLENPGATQSATVLWKARPIDTEITGIHCLTRGDIDKDGREDLVINNFLPDAGLRDSIAWLSVPSRPLEASQWNRHVFARGDARGGSHYMGIGDVTGDGHVDIAVGAKGSPFEDGNWFAFWSNPGPASPKARWKKTILATNQVGATNVVPGDVNGDGKLDWIASRGHGVGVLWFENPSWTLHEIDTALACPHSLTVADFDQDGDCDVASCGYESKRLMWYENDGTGQFSLHPIDGNQESYDLRSVDLDGDGDLDLLNAGRGSLNVVWYENRMHATD